MKINLGSGQNKLEGFINIDKFDHFQPDLVHDLEQCPWPFKDGEVTEVVAYHVLEHLGASTDVFFKILQELYRITAPGAFLQIAVPHHRSEHYFSDPTHVRPITLMTLTLLSKKNCEKWQQERAANSPLAVYLDIDFEIHSVEVKLTPHWEKKRNEENLSHDELNLAIEMFNNVVDEVFFIIQRV